MTHHFKGNWTPREQRVARHAIGCVPSSLVGSRFLDTIHRHDVLRGAPDHAPGHSKYSPKTKVITIYDKGASTDQKLKRSLWHELAHVILLNRPEIRRRWSLAMDRDPAIDTYAARSLDEDFAETLSEFLLDPQKTQRVVPQKSSLLAELLERAPEEKVAMSPFQGYVEEIVKQASAARFLRSPGAKMIGAAGLGAGGYGFGRSQGETSGKKRGRQELAQQIAPALRKREKMVFMSGFQQGARAGVQRLMSRLKQGQMQQQSGVQKRK